MSKTEATAEIFWTAFRALPEREQQAFLVRLVQDKDTRRDLLDLSMIERRRHESSRPLREYLARSR